MEAIMLTSNNVFHKSSNTEYFFLDEAMKPDSENNKSITSFRFGW